MQMEAFVQLCSLLLSTKTIPTIRKLANELTKHSVVDWSELLGATQVDQPQATDLELDEARVCELAKEMDPSGTVAWQAQYLNARQQLIKLIGSFPTKVNSLQLAIAENALYSGKASCRHIWRVEGGTGKSFIIAAIAVLAALQTKWEEINLVTTTPMLSKRNEEVFKEWFTVA